MGILVSSLFYYTSVALRCLLNYNAASLLLPAMLACRDASVSKVSGETYGFSAHSIYNAASTFILSTSAPKFISLCSSPRHVSQKCQAKYNTSPPTQFTTQPPRSSSRLDVCSKVYQPLLFPQCLHAEMQVSQKCQAKYMTSPPTQSTTQPPRASSRRPLQSLSASALPAINACMPRCKCLKSVMQNI